MEDGGSRVEDVTDTSDTADVPSAVPATAPVPPTATDDDDDDDKAPADPVTGTPSSQATEEDVAMLAAALRLSMGSGTTISPGIRGDGPPPTTTVPSLSLPPRHPPPLVRSQSTPDTEADKLAAMTTSRSLVRSMLATAISSGVKPVEEGPGGVGGRLRCGSEGSSAVDASLGAGATAGSSNPPSPTHTSDVGQTRPGPEDELWRRLPTLDPEVIAANHASPPRLARASSAPRRMVSVVSVTGSSSATEEA